MRHFWIGSILLSTAVSSTAASLGRYSGAVVIGRPLDIRVQALAGPDEDLASLCVQADVFFGDSQLGSGAVRTTVQRNAPDAEASIRVQTNAVVNEPIVSVMLRAGCSAPFSRRYVLLADPLSEPATPSGSQAGAAPTAAVAEVARVLPPLAPKSGEKSGDTREGAASAQGASKASSALVRGGEVRSAKPARPASVVRRPVEPAKDNTPRLQLDPVDLSLAIERDPALKLSLSLLSEPTSNEQERVAAAQLWKAINASPEDILRDVQKLSVLEAEAKGLREQEIRNKAALEEQENQARLMSWFAYLLGALLLLSLAALFFVWRRRATSPSTASTKNWWSTGGAQSVSAGGAKEAVATAAAKPVDIDLNVDDESSFDELNPLIDDDPQSGPAMLSSVDRRDFPSNQSAVSRSVATEELFDVQQQSDFFVSLGELEQAIGVLKNHLGESSEPSALAYLDLFKLYHKLGRRDEYEQLRDEFNHLFNAGAPPFEKYSDESHGLESYETAFGRIQALWPQPKVLDVIEQSIFRDANDVETEVFDLEAYRELLLLHAIAKDVIKRDTDGPSASDFQHTAIKPLKAAGHKAADQGLTDDALLGRQTQPSDDMPHASPRLGLDVDLDALSEMSAFEASLPDIEVAVEPTAKPVPPPGARPPVTLPEGNLIDFEVLDFMPPDEDGSVKGKSD